MKIQKPFACKRTECVNVCVALDRRAVDGVQLMVMYCRSGYLVLMCHPGFEFGVRVRGDGADVG